MNILGQEFNKIADVIQRIYKKEVYLVHADDVAGNPSSTVYRMERDILLHQAGQFIVDEHGNKYIIIIARKSFNFDPTPIKYDTLLSYLL